MTFIPSAIKIINKELASHHTGEGPFYTGNERRAAGCFRF
ncbi:hypothetical protein CLOSTASPAR_06451 [[Clostridium] asparagiforme DSM 15981]|uniref:Uncharacterized protein n=1 Tax=[Clostridium] asparagiforme DSM 15981 TaxID=518636 RepID=C0DAZ6_9FIRM|nr:hypothetical protein CLOSTASPAR_06451 [[Clostridium] asparagiforme DSM 15981]